MSGSTANKTHSVSLSGEEQARDTYVDDPVLRVVGIGTAQIEATVVVANRLNHTDMIAAVETLAEISTMVN